MCQDNIIPVRSPADLFSSISLNLERFPHNELADIVLLHQHCVVNPQAVNEPGFDVLSSNRRAILYMTHAGSGQKVAFVAVGAMLVGSIEWTKGGQTGATVTRGEDLGYVTV